MTGAVREELFLLLGALANQTITPEQHRRLEELLSEGPEARQFYFDYLDLHFSLHDWQLRDEEAEPLAALRQQLETASPSAGRPRFRQWMQYVLVAAATVLLTFLVQSAWRTWRPMQAGAGENEYVATLVNTADCVWSVGETWREGSRLPLGEFRLLAGVVEIRFDSGAQLVVEGPAVLKIESTSGATLIRGKVVLKSDETADAFVLQTPTSTLLDRGTEFAVAVSPTGEEVHVFDGEVQRMPKLKDPRRAAPEQITAGQAKQYASKAVTVGKSVPLSERRFVRQVPDRKTPAPSPTADLLAYEGFDYPAAALPENAAGGLGWARPWAVNKPTPLGLSSQSLDRATALVPAIGGAIDFSGAAGASRPFVKPIRFDRDGVYYFSILFRRYPAEAKTANAFSLIFRNSQNNDPQKRLVVGVGESNHILFLHFEGGGARAPLPLEYEKTYLLVGKIVTAASRPDQVFLRVYRPEEPVLTKEPGSWSLACRPVQSSLTLDWLGIYVNSPARQALDEFRLGTTWASVTSPWAK
jgi:hypothetical protein